MLAKKTLDRLVSGEPVAARLPAAEEINRWIVVFPFKIHPETGMPTIYASSKPWQYRIRCIGVPADFDYYEFDLHDEYITSYEDSVVRGLDEVETGVLRWLESVSELSDPRECECPI